MSEHIYCGSGKEKIFDNGGSIISVSLDMDDIRKHWADYGFTTTSGKQILKLKIGKRREEGRYGETHTVEIDTWKPTNGGPSDPDRVPF
jgi:hypothetical protein